MTQSNEKQKENEPPLSRSAKVTVNGLNSFQTWDFFLNGVNIGTIEGCAQVTATAISQRKNVLTAKDAKGIITPPYEFYIESGSDLEIDFDGGRFVRARSINKATQNAASERAKPKELGWLYWAGLSGFCAVIFLSGLESIILALVLSFFTVMALLIPRSSTHRAMVEYLADNYPELWAEIAREQYTNRTWGPRDLIFVKDACDDPEYLEIRKKHKKIFIAQMSILCTFFVSYFYFVITKAA